jgi:phage FluMu protein Com
MKHYLRKSCPTCGIMNQDIEYRSWTDELGVYQYEGKCHKCKTLLFAGFDKMVRP